VQSPLSERWLRVSNFRKMCGMSTGTKTPVDVLIFWEKQDGAFLDRHKTCWIGRSRCVECGRDDRHQSGEMSDFCYIYCISPYYKSSIFEPSSL
jgi:hypothetical protein